MLEGAKETMGALEVGEVLEVLLGDVEVGVGVDVGGEVEEEEKADEVEERVGDEVGFP